MEDNASLLVWEGPRLIQVKACCYDKDVAIKFTALDIITYCEKYGLCPYFADITGLLNVPHLLRVDDETLDAAVMARVLERWRSPAVVCKGAGYLWVSTPAQFPGHRTTDASVTFSVDNAGAVTYDPGEYLFAGGERPPVYAAPGPADVEAAAAHADTPMPARLILRRIAAHMRGERPAGVSA